MLTVIAFLHILVCIMLIAMVLLQDPKSGGAGGVFGGGGGTSSLLGTTGAVTFLTRLTRYLAIVFGVTCLILTLLSRPDTGSVVDGVAAPLAHPQGIQAPGAAAPPAPGTAAPTAGSTGGTAK